MMVADDEQFWLTMVNMVNMVNNGIEWWLVAGANAAMVEKHWHIFAIVDDKGLW